MSSSMGNQLHTVEGILLGVELLKEHQTVVELDGPRVLLTKQLEVGQEGYSILLKRTGDACIAFHPFEGASSLIEDLIDLSHLFRISLTIERTHRIALTLTSLLVEVTSHERIKESGQRTAGVADHRLPA